MSNMYIENYADITKLHYQEEGDLSELKEFSIGFIHF
jgi:hypothetical protein